MAGYGNLMAVFQPSSQITNQQIYQVSNCEINFIKLTFIILLFDKYNNGKNDHIKNRIENIDTDYRGN